MQTYVGYRMSGAHKLLYPKRCSTIMWVIHNDEGKDIGSGFLVDIAT